MQKKIDTYLSAYRKKELSDLAEFIAESYCPDNVVNPELVAKKLGISFNYGNYKNAFDGLIQYLEGKFHIYINMDRLKNPYSVRSRFTFAHELGHYFIDEHRNALIAGEAPVHSSFTNFSSETYTEWEADYFASSLLLPRERFLNDCKSRKFSFSLLDEFSKKYQTSLTATAIKYADFDSYTYPILIVFSVNRNIKWYWMSNDFPYKYLIYGKNKIPEDTVMGEYFSGKEISKNTQIVWAMDWFRYVRDEDVNRKFNEHCIPYKNMAMSIIWED